MVKQPVKETTAILKKLQMETNAAIRIF